MKEKIEWTSEWNTKERKNKREPNERKEQKSRQQSKSYPYLYSRIIQRSRPITFSISGDVVLRASHSLRTAIRKKRVVLIDKVTAPAKCLMGIMKRIFFHPHTALKRRDVNCSPLELTTVLNEWYLSLKLKGRNRKFKSHTPFKRTQSLTVNTIQSKQLSSTFL